MQNILTLSATGRRRGKMRKNSKKRTNRYTKRKPLKRRTRVSKRKTHRRTFKGKRRINRKKTKYRFSVDPRDKEIAGGAAEMPEPGDDIIKRGLVLLSTDVTRMDYGIDPVSCDETYGVDCRQSSIALHKGLQILGYSFDRVEEFDHFTNITVRDLIKNIKALSQNKKHNIIFITCIGHYWFIEVKSNGWRILSHWVNKHNFLEYMESGKWGGKFFNYKDKLIELSDDLKCLFNQPMNGSNREMMDRMNQCVKEVFLEAEWKPNDMEINLIWPQEKVINYTRIIAIYEINKMTPEPSPASAPAPDYEPAPRWPINQMVKMGFTEDDAKAKLMAAERAAFARAQAKAAEPASAPAPDYEPAPRWSIDAMVKMGFTEDDAKAKLMAAERAAFARAQAKAAEPASAERVEKRLVKLAAREAAGGQLPEAPDRALGQLISMGFHPEASLEALKSKHGDVKQAINMLLENYYNSLKKKT